MMIVDTLARRWGCDALPTGKVVWAWPRHDCCRFVSWQGRFAQTEAIKF